jgi:hypothetical protein
MPRDKSAILSALKKKGFQEVQSHHTRLIYFTADGRKTPVMTKLSHTPKMKVVPDPLLGQMAKQCRLSKDQFLDLVDCSLGQKEFEGILVDLGVVDRPDDQLPTGVPQR